MAGHVIRSLVVVMPARLAVGRQFREEGLQIVLHIRIGIFLNQQRRKDVAVVV